MVTIALRQTSHLLYLLRKTGRLGINLLGVHQEQLARDFAQDGIDRFSTVAWAEDHGLPLLRGGIGWIVCDSVRLVRGGDHELVVGQVVHAEHVKSLPLVYRERQFGTFINHRTKEG
jgi:flavin reductase (DIM6/NTAB) family NADH-FMN oxidoreductase RutF